MIKIAYGQAGFRRGLLIGLAAALFSIAFLELPIYWGSSEGRGLGDLHDFANTYFYVLVVIQFLLFVSLPGAVLLKRGRFKGLVGMLLVIVPVSVYLWFSLYVTALGSFLR